MSTNLEAKIRNRSATVGVIGLGYVGLPLAVTLSDLGFGVVGFDISEATVGKLNAGGSHIDDVTESQVRAFIGNSRVKVTSHEETLRTCDAVFICVPTPFDDYKTPDLSYVEAASRTVARILHPEMLIILQSTTYPGTTEEFVRPILESSGLTVGNDFYLAFSPERVDPGNQVWTVRNTPKVVGGVSAHCTYHAKLLLETFMDEPRLVHAVESPAVAELCKLLENTYRAVNIALVNELAQLCHRMEIDVWSVVAAAATKPFGFQAFSPGIGPGGHCIPVDPFYLAWKAREFGFQTRFVELAAEINNNMADYVIHRIQDVLNEANRPLRGTHILCLGASFKPGVSDIRNSRALHVMKLLLERGAVLEYCDALVPTIQVGDHELSSIRSDNVVKTSATMVVVLVGGAWPLDDLEARNILVFDAVNAGGSGGKLRTRL